MPTVSMSDEIEPLGFRALGVRGSRTLSARQEVYSQTSGFLAKLSGLGEGQVQPYCKALNLKQT